MRTSFEAGRELAREYLPVLVRTGVLDETERGFLCGLSGAHFPHDHGNRAREHRFHSEGPCFCCGQQIPEESEGEAERRAERALTVDRVIGARPPVPQHIGGARRPATPAQHPVPEPVGDNPPE